MVVVAPPHSGFVDVLALVAHGRIRRRRESDRCVHTKQKAGSVFRCTVHTRQKTKTVKQKTFELCRRRHTAAVSCVLSSEMRKGISAPSRVDTTTTVNDEFEVDPSVVFLVVYHALSCSTR